MSNDNFEYYRENHMTDYNEVRPQILKQGRGEPLGWHDPDENRAWVRDNKTRALIDKRTTLAQAVENFIPDGSFIAVGGFGHVRVPMALIYEMIRQRRRNLALSGKTAVHIHRISD